MIATVVYLPLLLSFPCRVRTEIKISRERSGRRRRGMPKRKCAGEAAATTAAAAAATGTVWHRVHFPAVPPVHCAARRCRESIACSAWVSNTQPRLSSARRFYCTCDPLTQLVKHWRMQQITQTHNLRLGSAVSRCVTCWTRIISRLWYAWICSMSQFSVKLATIFPRLCFVWSQLQLCAFRPAQDVSTPCSLSFCPSCATPPQPAGQLISL